jgi:hypothetical protein
MKNIEYLLVLFGVALVWWLSTRTKESFVPEFLDQSNVKRTAETSSSSYSQQTNHTKPTPYPQDPIQGMETPFRVNMFNSYMV